MTVTHCLACLCAALLLVANSVGQDAAAPLPLSQAAKLAEDAIAAAHLPPDHFLRSIRLVQNPDQAPYYRATYTAPVVNRVRVGSEPEPIKIDVLRITMDGKVSFEQEDVSPRRSVQMKAHTQP